MHAFRATVCTAILATLPAFPVLAYENPILSAINDPDCIQMNGLYRLIEPEGGGRGYYNYRTSNDLVHWSDPVRILQQDRGTALWQGSYFRDRDGQLYLYYATVDRDQTKMVHVAKADGFTGSYTDLGIVAQNAIDPFPMRAHDGSLWLYYKNTTEGEKSIWAQRMTNPASVDAGSAAEILHPESQTFEDNGFQSVEGPTVIYRAGLYFLLYTGGPYGDKSYAVGYAVSKDPGGPFERGPNNPILSNTLTPEVYSPGVPTVVRDGAGKSWLVYRQRISPEKGSQRVLAIDRLDDSKAGLGILSANATSRTKLPDPVPLP